VWFTLGAIDEGFAASRRNAEREALASNVQQMETTMRKTVLTIVAALLISGLAVQMAAASQHHRSKAYFGRDLSDLRGSYNQVNGPTYVTPRVPDRFDPSRPGGEDPTLNPSGS
jgi:hypothetical protein